MPQFSTRDSIGFELYVSGVDISAEVVDGTTYHNLVIDGAFPYAEEGAPAVPVIRKLVAIPESEGVIVEARVVESAVTSDLNVHPAPRLVPSQLDPGQYDREFVRDEDIYSTNANFPGDYVRIEDIGYLRGQRLAWVHVYPVQFNPVRNEITVASHLEIKVVTDQPRGDVNRGVGPMSNILRNVAINYDLWAGHDAAAGLGGGPQATSGEGTIYLCGLTSADLRVAADSVNTLGEPDYLIIMADELDDGLVWDLAQHRATYNGFNVSIVKMSQIHDDLDITDTPDSIHAFVKEVFDAKSAAHMADSALAYVLLMGDAYNPDFDVLIPSSYECVSGDIGANGAASDAYYSFVDDGQPCSDPFPDLFIGRIPADRDSVAPDSVYWELSNVVNKVLSYEPLPTESWVDSVLLVSGIDTTGFSLEGEGASGFDNFFDDIIQETFPASQHVRKKHRLDEMGLSNTEFSKELNDLVDSTSYRIIGLFDHGNTAGLSGSWFPMHYDTIRNTRSLPIVLSFASYTGCFDFEESLKFILDACIFEEGYSGAPCQPGSNRLDDYDISAERLVLQENGAIGLISYSRTQQAEYAKVDFQNLFHALYEDNAATLGELVLGTRLLANDGGLGVSLRNLQLLGDPAVNILWRDVAWDSVDVSVGSSDILLASGVKSYAPASDLEVKVIVSNLTNSQADSVKVVLLDNHPDSTAVSVLDSAYVDPVPAFGSASVVLDAGSWDPGTVELWVHVDPDSEFNEPTTTNNVAHATFRAIPYETDFPKVLKPSFPIALANVNTSGANPGKEILTGTQCYSSDGDSLWAVSSATIFGKPLVGYPFCNGAPYTLTVFTFTPTVRIIDASDGSIHHTFGFSGSGIPSGTPVLFTDSPTSDSLQVAMCIKQGYDNYMKSYTTDGTQVWSVPFGDGTVQSLLQQSALAMGDLELDGDLEIVCGFSFLLLPDTVIVLENGSRRWATAVGDAPGEIAVALADLDDDGDLEVLANGGFSAPDTSCLYILNETTGSVEETAGFPQAPLRYAIGDIDTDGDLEAVVAAGDSLAVLDDELTVLDGTALGDVIAPVSQPLLVDITGDDDLEIVLLAEAIDSLTEEYSLKLQTYDSAPDSIGLWYEFSHYDNKSIGQPAIDDIDDDGVHEIVFVSSDSVLHAFEIGDDAGRRDWGEQFQNAMQTSLIEQPVEGTYSKPTALFNRVRVTGDAVFDSTLYIDATADIAVVSTDTLIEISVNDHFTLVGSATDSVHIYSDPASSDSAAWSGILFDNADGGGADSMAYFVITDAEIGVENRSPLLLTDGRVSATYNTGIYASDSVIVRRVEVSDSDGRGFYAGSGVVASLYDSDFDRHASSGVVCDTCSNQSIFSGGSASGNALHGLHLEGSYSNVISMVLQDNDYNGIRVVEASPDISNCYVKSNNIGIYCYAGSEPVVSYCEIRGNVNGVFAAVSSYPHLGEGASGNPTGGHNCMHKNTGTHLSVVSDPSEPVYANYNHWDPTCCPTGKIYGYVVCGSCDTSPECDAPQGVAPAWPRDENSRFPPKYALGHPVPNPFNPVTTVRFDVPPPGSRVSITVYNVRGQRVADLLNEYKQPGYHLLRWDGTNRSGNAVASGVYFIHMRATDFAKTVKAVVLK